LSGQWNKDGKARSGGGTLLGISGKEQAFSSCRSLLADMAAKPQQEDYGDFPWQPCPLQLHTRLAYRDRSNLDNACLILGFQRRTCRECKRVETTQ
jgi:hypothetical protein